MHKRKKSRFGTFTKYVARVRINEYGQGLIRLGTVAIDGTKVRANASKHKAMSYKRMQAEERRLEDEIAGMCAQASATDAREDGLYGADRRGDELPEELQYRQQRLEKIRAAKARLEAEQRERIRSAAGTMVMMASRRGIAGGGSNATLACRRIKRRAILPIRRAAS